MRCFCGPDEAPKRETIDLSTMGVSESVVSSQRVPGPGVGGERFLFILELKFDYITFVHTRLITVATGTSCTKCVIFTSST